MFRPLNGRVFVERDPDEEELMGFVVGDRAKVKSLYGTVVDADSENFAKGDRIHLPHQKAKQIDCDVDGRELTCVKESDLFAIEEDGVLRPVNRYLRVRKCEEDHIRDESGAIRLYMTENYIEETLWVEIVDIAEDCEWVPPECIGWFCISPENDEKLQRCGRTKDYFLHEELIKFITDGS